MISTNNFRPVDVKHAASMGLPRGIERPVQKSNKFRMQLVEPDDTRAHAAASFVQASFAGLRCPLVAWTCSTLYRASTERRGRASQQTTMVLSKRQVLLLLAVSSLVVLACSEETKPAPATTAPSTTSTNTQAAAEPTKSYHGDDYKVRNDCRRTARATAMRGASTRWKSG
jgi:hypothetical protein